jgi:hypothetical protein
MNEHPISISPDTATGTPEQTDSGQFTYGKMEQALSRLKRTPVKPKIYDMIHAPWMLKFTANPPAAPNLDTLTGLPCLDPPPSKFNASGTKTHRTTE